MFTSPSSSSAGRDRFLSVRSKRLKTALMWKAIKKTKTLTTKAKKERGPPKALAAA